MGIKARLVRFANMARRKKIIVWIGGLFGLLICLILTLQLLLPKLLNLDAVRSKVLSTLSQQLGGEVAYEHIDISLFPLPHVVIHQISLTVPEMAKGTLVSCKIRAAWVCTKEKIKRI